MNTSKATEIESSPDMTLFGTLTYVLDPSNFRPWSPPQDGVPTTVPFLPLPEESVATDPEVSSNWYRSTRPSVIAPVVARSAWAGAGTAIAESRRATALSAYQRAGRRRVALPIRSRMTDSFERKGKGM